MCFSLLFYRKIKTIFWPKFVSFIIADIFGSLIFFCKKIIVTSNCFDYFLRTKIKYSKWLFLKSEWKKVSLHGFFSFVPKVLKWITQKKYYLIKILNWIDVDWKIFSAMWNWTKKTSSSELLTEYWEKYKRCTIIIFVICYELNCLFNIYFVCLHVRSTLLWYTFIWINKK